MAALGRTSARYVGREIQQSPEPGDEFLKCAYQQAADEGTPGLVFSASCSLGIRRPAGMASSTSSVSGFSARHPEVSTGLLFECCRMARHRGGLGFKAWCCVMPQGDMITVDDWVPAAKSKPLVKLAHSAMQFTPKGSESPSGFTVAERNVCAEIESDDSDGPAVTGPNGRVVQPSFVAALILGSKNSGVRRLTTMELETVCPKHWTRILPKPARLRQALAQSGRMLLRG